MAVQYSTVSPVESTSAVPTPMSRLRSLLASYSPFDQTDLPVGGVSDEPGRPVTVLDHVVAWGTLVAFWAAVALPFVHVPLLLGGLETQAETVAFLGLLGLNVLSLVAGHAHRHD